MRHGDGGKLDDRRPEAEPGNFERGYEGINWNAREEEKRELDRRDQRDD